jgi:hypothetical protein
MHSTRSSFHRAARAVAFAAAALAAPLVAEAQAINYPTFQPPRIVGREYAGGVADGDGVTSVVF